MLFIDCYSNKKEEISRIIALSSEFSAPSDSRNRAKSLEFRSYCAGLLSVAFCAAIESALKNILIEFGAKQHPLVAEWSKARFEKLNGKIKIKEICDEYLIHYGSERVAEFKKSLTLASKEKYSIEYDQFCSEYSQLMIWRHEFAHAGNVICTIEDIDKNKEKYWLVVETIDLILS
jgi:RiboL-PSP-HEPN